MAVIIKTPEQIQKMRVAGKLAAEVLEMIEPFVKAGVSTGELDTICHKFMTEEQGCIPAPLNYHGFPKSICTSINHVICHGIPSDSKFLKDGDVINIDITVIKDGYHGDTSKMFYVGEVKPFAKKLTERTQQCLYKAIQIVKPGVTLGDIGSIIQKHAEKRDENGVAYTIVQEYCGHGIGEGFHEEPQVMHFGKPGQGLTLKEGMIFTIEPMLNAGKRHCKLNKKDGWTVTTKDGKLSTQFEHTIVVTPDGCEVLTAREEERDIFTGSAVFRQD